MKIVDDMKAHMDAMEAHMEGMGQWFKDMAAHLHAAPKPPVQPVAPAAPAADSVVMPPAPPADKHLNLRLVGTNNAGTPFDCLDCGASELPWTALNGLLAELHALVKGKSNG